MPKIHISKRAVDGLPAKALQHFERLKARNAGKERRTAYVVWDDKIDGFGIRVQPSGHATYFLKYRAASGRQRWLKIATVGTLTPEEARDLADQERRAAAKGNDPGAKKMKLKELAEKFLIDIEARKKPATYVHYEILLRKHVLPKLGSCKAEMLTSADIADLHRELGSKKGSKHPYQANRVLAVLSAMYGFAARQHIVPRGCNPAKGIARFAERGRERFLNGAELTRLGEAIREAETIGLPYAVDEAGQKAKHAPKPKNRRTKIGPHAAAAIRLLLFTGARLREILHLQWAHVDLERRLLLLPDSKTGKKTIVLNAPALKVLDGLEHAADYVIAGADPRKPRTDLNKPWEAVRRRAGLDGVRLHDLRHSFASFGAGGGHGLPIIGKLLGHTQAATTQRYAHLDADPLRVASDAIGRRIATALGEPVATDGDGSVVPMRRGSS